ncbi:helix-turn-helix transcriptional regulator [Oceanicaulis sp.]|uniref:helix-turn-helix transcriptional regulator n=1 Tax=Oceanicaulis sp. TaxID=1924941 RepID=UPI003F71E274
MTEAWVQFISSVEVGVALFAALQLYLQDRREADARPRHARKGLAAFLILSALSGFELLFDQSGFYDEVPILVGVLWPFRLFYGPVLLVYVLDMTRTPDVAWPMRLKLVIWGPAIAAFVASLSFFILPAPLRQTVYGLSDADTPFAIIVVLVFRGLFLVMTLAYLSAAFWVLTRHLKTVRQIFSNIENRTLSWLRAVLLIMLAAWSWAAITTVFLFSLISDPVIDLVDALVECAWIVTLGLYGLWQTPVYRDQTDAPQTLEPVEKYARSALSAERQAQIAGRLDAVMQRDKLYRDPMLSLSALASRLAVSPNHLSQSLNGHLGTSFFDYVNRLRVEEAVTRIRRTSDPLLTIAYDVGFNSRSTFNLAVKKTTGRTPSAFREG